MLCIDNPYTDIDNNLAIEIYLLKHFSEDIFMLWQSEPSVVIGRHQQVEAEVNLPFTQREHIKVARRFSGGGAVYHDLGNLNLTFIENGNKIHEHKYTHLIIRFLRTLGIEAVADERQAIFVGGLKVSGSAQSIYKNRVMHHATLLFDTDLEKLRRSLEGHPTEEKGRIAYVKSVKSPVTNLKSHTTCTLATFREKAFAYFLEAFSGEIYPIDTFPINPPPSTNPFPALL